MSSKIIVIGNGFDLAAGAKTSYANYFESDFYKETKEKAIKWINYCLAGSYRGSSLAVLYEDDPSPFNCWDLLFCMKSSHIDRLNCYSSIRNWCDIEQVIHESLTQRDKRVFSWRVIYDYIHELKRDVWGQATNYPALEENNIMFKFLISTGWVEKSDSLDHFYTLLLNELNKFERSFGLYILSVTNESEEYLFNAKRNVELLAHSKENILVDSFNYSTFYGEQCTIRHINGDTDNPIFGIDLNEEDEAKFYEARCFTKTSRRLQQDALNISDVVDIGADSINEVVVFGHSLNAMDFDYFNYLFTLLKFNTFDIDKMGRIEFVYKLHSDNSHEYRTQYADKVYRILNRYEKYVSQSSQHIHINLLRFSGKLSIMELS